ncbi:MAG TPA: metalloregulator ArsR/SmtB family transcription factor [Sphingomicrobium sp.]|nr:metalloregulator ArsR/SmtB family transcription factor [Sphingomicrobium sp.]
MIDQSQEVRLLETRAEDVAAILKTLSNPRRLLLLCKLVERGRMSVGQLAASVGLSQSALSQHLAVMRDDQLVAYDRAGQTLYYRIADERLTALLGSLYSIYCTSDDQEEDEDDDREID